MFTINLFAATAGSRSIRECSRQWHDHLVVVGNTHVASAAGAIRQEVDGHRSWNDPVG